MRQSPPPSPATARASPSPGHRAARPSTVISGSVWPACPTAPAARPGPTHDAWTDVVIFGSHVLSPQIGTRAFAIDADRNMGAEDGVSSRRNRRAGSQHFPGERTGRGTGRGPLQYRRAGPRRRVARLRSRLAPADHVFGEPGTGQA